ncbi:MAG: Y-family DNA polymerase [Persicimonas sp.]
MDRLACVNLIDLPLQLLLRRHPKWKTDPVVVVDKDEPGGTVEWVNKYARRARILPGMRYGEALSLKHDLEAGCVESGELAASIEAVAKRLLDYTPHVEAADDQPGIFWLDAAGFERLFGSFESWAKAVAEELLEREGFYTTIVVGFGRFGTWAIARAKRGGLLILGEPDEQDLLVRRVPLEALHVDPKFRDALNKLGIRTVGDFLKLPPDGVHRRFGQQALQLYRRARGDLKMPLVPYSPDDAPAEHLELGSPERNSTRLVFWLKRYLHPLLVELDRRQDKLVSLEIIFIFERGAGAARFGVRPAEPTVDEAQVLELIRLRLESLELSAGVVEVELTAHTTRARQEQIRMFVAAKGRDLGAANRALARLRAEFGDSAVVRARLRDGHLPEARFEWQPLERLEEAEPREPDIRPLIRRIRRRPESLSGPIAGPFSNDSAGPFVVSGGWWAGGVDRHYHFVEDENGEVQWIYWDARRGRWFRHGGIE